MSPEFLKAFLQLSPLWSLSLISFIPLTAKVLNGNKELKAEVVSGIFGLGLISSMLLFVFVGQTDEQIFSLRFDSYGTGACLLAGFASLISLLLFHLNTWIDRKQLTEILFFFSHGLLGLYILCLSQDLMTAFIGLETASLTIYMNLAMSRKDLFCLEAAIKYFILSALSGVVFLYGLSFLFGSTGTLDWNQFFLAENVSPLYNRFFFLGWALVFSALFFKVALFPFQFWLPDVYQGALTPMTAFMATAVKSSLVLFLGRLFALSFFEEHGDVFLLGLALASVLTVLFGNIMALKQTQLKRLVAFSSLAHSGYLMMALYGILNLTGPAKDFSLIFYYLLAYIVLTSALLLAFQTLEKNSSQAKIEDLSSLFYSNPLLALGISVTLLGLAGVPPSFGFFAKLAFFQPLILSASWWLLFWAIVGSAIGLYYYMKPISRMLEKGDKAPVQWPRLAQFFFLILVVFGLLGAFLFDALFR